MLCAIKETKSMRSTPYEICRLCHKEKQLSFSHIIPEFMYLEMYDEKHRALIVDSDSTTKEQFVQKGEREYLFCSDCEERLSSLETYASPIVKSLLNLEAENASDSYIKTGISYPRFKLFQMSLLWRASVSSIAMFENVSLEAHEETLRKMILSNKPGDPNDYGCLMMLMQNTTYLHKMSWSPVTDEIGGILTYRFLTGRLFWYFFLPEHYPPDAARYFITESGILHVLKAPWSEEEVIRRLAGSIAKARLQ